MKNIKKIALLAVLFFIVLAHISLRNNHPSNDGTENSGTTKQQSSSTAHWLQPAYLNDRYPQLIGSTDWQLDFIIIEEKISKLKLNSDHSLLINGDTADTLQLINIELDKNMSKKQWQRLQFLLIKSLGENTGESFYKLINAYHYYDQEQQLQSVKIKASEFNVKIELVKKQSINNRKIQAHYFGSETATKLFSKKNQTTDYLNSRRIINMDKSLSPKQKQDQLSILVKNYKKTLENR